MSKLDEMWAALEAHKPDASYADAWQTMCRERTKEAIAAAYDAAPEGLAAEAAAWATWAAASDRCAQHAINALKREVKP